MLKGYRTVIFNIIVMILPALETIDVTNVLGTKGASEYIFIVGIGNLICRFYTTSPIFKNASTPTS